MLKKKVLSGLLAIAMVFGSAAALPEGVFDTSASITASAVSTATSGKCGENVKWKLTDGKLTISGTGEMTDYSNKNSPFCDRTDIQTVVIGSGVTSIGNRAFCNCSKLVNITIPDSVTRIGNSALKDCESLTDVTIPSGVISIDDYAFSGCKSLKSVTIPNSVKYLGTAAFINCESLTSVTIPSSVTYIYKSAFSNCKSLTSVTIPNSVSSIDEYAFAFCESLKSVTIPNSVKIINEGAFYECTNLESITIPSSVESIGNDAIDKECTIICEKGSKAEKYAKDNGLDYNYSDGDYLYKELGDGTVEITKYSGNYTILNIPSTLDGKQVTSIGSDAFSDRTYLEKIIIPSGVTNIAEKAFASAPALKKVTIPNSVTTIGDNAFKKSTTIICTKSSYAYVYAALYSIKCEYIAEDYIYKDIDDETVEITGYTGEDKTLIIPSTLAGKTVTSIGNEAFKAYISLTNVTIPNSVTSIGDDAFSRCRNIESVTIPSSVRRFGEFAFGECDKLESAVIPTGVETISYALFADCRGLKSITIPSSVKSIENSAFGNCSGLTNITIPGNVTYIGASAFEGCTGLKSLTIPSSVKTIDDYAFGACGFTSLTVPKTVTKIGKMAIGYVHNEQHRLVKDNKFTVKCYKGTAAEKYAKDNELDYIIFDGDYLYKELKDETVEITGYTGKASALSIPSTLGGKTVTSIGNSAFYDCKSLTNVTILNSVTSIGVNAFRDCTSLTSITIPNSVTSIGTYAFAGCTRLKSVTIPNSVTRIGTYAFGSCTSLTSITISNSVAETGIGAFYNCLSLASVTIPSGVTVISGEAFKYCTGLTSITIPDSVTSIQSDAFAGCSSLKSITIPKSVTSIGSDAFTKCTSLNSLTIPKSVTKIYKRAFGYNNEEGEKNNDFVVKCYKGTAAETYAKDNGFKIEYIGLKHIAAKAATCTADGNIEYWKHDGKFYSDAKLTTEITQAKTVVKATGHKYGEPTWTWTGTTAATAKFVCANDKTHVQNIKATIKSTTTKPTCTKAGKTVYTATVKFGDKTYTNSKTVTLKALGHKMGDWKTTSFNVDKKTATQTRKCARGDKTETQTVKNAIVRYAGSDRAQTASLISSGMYKTANTVVIATGFDFHDALAAVPLASAYNAPLLLADRDNLSDKTINEIKRLKAKNVIVVASTNAKDQNGNDAAIKSNVYNQLKELKVKVTKLDGANYYATAKKVADALGKKKAAPTSVFITTDKNYADALSASPVAAILGAPILYVDPKASLNATTKNYLASIKKNVKNVYIVGGVNAVSKNVEKSVLSVLGKKSATRFAGDNRYDTCVKINKAFAKTLTGKSVCIAKGYNFPDALAGGVFAAKQKAPLFLADKLDAKATLNNVQSSYLKSKNPNKLYIFGGENAVPTQLVKTISKACV